MIVKKKKILKKKQKKTNKKTKKKGFRLRVRDSSNRKKNF